MDIALLKKRLVELGFGPLTTTGTLANSYGEKTTAAVRAFQLKAGLTVDGIMGPKTISALFDVEKGLTQYDAATHVRPFAGVSSNELAQRAAEIMLSQVGVREATGKNDGPAVEDYLQAVGLGKGNSWCMALEYWSTAHAAAQLDVRNPLLKTASCMEQFYYQKKQGRVFAEPLPYDIGILDLGGGHGHTFTVLPNGILPGVAVTDGRVKTVEGNTNDDGSANGNGVYLRNRSATNLIAGYIRIS